MRWYGAMSASWVKRGSDGSVSAWRGRRPSWRRADQAVKALKFVVGRLRFPAYAYAPLAAAKDSKPKYPLVIFSHGLAGTRHTYTQYCSALASQGYVVLAVEHRDGSAPAVTLPPAPPADGLTTPTKQAERVLGYIKKDEIAWEGGESGSLEKFRTSQLEMRVREVYEAYQSFGRIVQGDVSNVILERIDTEVRHSWAGSMRDKVDMSQVELTGHSFGAGTVVSQGPVERWQSLITASSLAYRPSGRHIHSLTCQACDRPGPMA